MAIENIEIGTVTNDGKGERLALAFDVANANFNELETGKENPLTFSSPLVRTVDAVSIPKASSGINGYLSGSDWNTFINKQSAITLTTTGTSGASTLIGSTLNIPQYNGGGGGIVGLHSLISLASGAQTAAVVNGGNLSNSASVANQMRANPYIPNQSFVSSNFYINVSLPLVGALGRIAVYSNLNGLPNSQLYLSSNLDLSTSGIKTAAVSFNFVAGTTYWLCFHTSAVVTMGIISPTNTVCLKILTTSMMLTITNTATFASGTPVTFGTSTYSTTPAFFIGITK